MPLSRGFDTTADSLSTETMANCIQCGRKMPGLSFGRKKCQWCLQYEATQRGESADDAPQIVMPAPWVQRGGSTITLTRVLFGINIAVFLAMVFRTSNPAAYLNPLQEFSGGFTVGWGSNWGPLTLTGDWWRLLTYIFLHGSLMHIAFNMWCLWDLGALCESLYGRATFAAVYLITGVAGGVASIGWRPLGATVGASGAIFGLAGALVASFYLGEFSLPRAAIAGTLRSLAFFVVINVALGGMFPGVDNACHIGGLVSGLILGALIAIVAPGRDQVAQRIGVLVFVAVIVIVSAVGVFRWRGSQFHFDSGPDSRIFSQVISRTHV